MGEAASDRRLVALRLDPRPEDLEFEEAAVTGVEQAAEDAAQRDVAVAGDCAIGRLQGADDEVVHLHDAQQVQVAAHGVHQPTLAPGVVDLHAHAESEPAGEVAGVAQRVREADVESQAVGVLDREFLAVRPCLGDDRSDRLLECVGRSLPGEARGTAGGDDHAAASERRGNVEAGAQAVAPTLPLPGVRQFERVPDGEVVDAQARARHDVGDRTRAVAGRLEFAKQERYVADSLRGEEIEVAREWPADRGSLAEREPRVRRHGRDAISPGGFDAIPRPLRSPRPFERVAMPSDPDPVAVQPIPLDGPYLRTLGLERAESTRGGVRIRLAHRGDNANRNGTLHGGVIASLVETAGSLALERATASAPSPSAPASASRPTAVDLSIHFVAPAVERDVVADARVVRRGRVVGFADVDVATEDGATIARGMLAARTGTAGGAPTATQGRRGAADRVEQGGDGPGAGDPAQTLPEDHRAALERLAFARFSGSAFSARLQVRSARIPGAGVIALLPWQDLLADASGAVHAGAIATLIDAAGGASAWTAGGFDPRGRASTIAMHLTLASAPAGADLVAVAQPPWCSGEYFSIAVEVSTRATATPVAAGSVVYRVVRPA